MMINLSRPPFARTRPWLAAGLSAALLLAAVPSPADAQAPAAPASPGFDALPVSIGQATRGDTSYAVSATAPLDSPVKGQRLRLLVRAATVSGTDTGYVLVNTGKSKTLASLSQTLALAMRRFAAGGAAPGQEFAKIGDIRYGGELRLVAETPDRLVFRYDPPTTRPITLTPADALAFANILQGKGN